MPGYQIFSDWCWILKDSNELFGEGWYLSLPCHCSDDLWPHDFQLISCLFFNKHLFFVVYFQRWFLNINCSFYQFWFETPCVHPSSKEQIDLSLVCAAHAAQIVGSKSSTLWPLGQIFFHYFFWFTLYLILSPTIKHNLWFTWPSPVNNSLLIWDFINGRQLCFLQYLTCLPSNWLIIQHPKHHFLISKSIISFPLTKFLITV